MIYKSCSTAPNKPIVGQFYFVHLRELKKVVRVIFVKGHYNGFWYQIEAGFNARRTSSPGFFADTKDELVRYWNQFFLKKIKLNQSAMERLQKAAL